MLKKAGGCWTSRLNFAQCPDGRRLEGENKFTKNVFRPYRAPELFTCEIGTEIGPSVDIWVFIYLQIGFLPLFSHLVVCFMPFAISHLLMMKFMNEETVVRLDGVGMG